jgi:GGDEF domain-containing protein
VSTEHPGVELSLLEATATAQRSLLRARRPEDVVRALERAVHALGGEIAPAHVGGEDVLQLDISLGVRDALVPVAPPGGQARSHLQQVLPGLLEDARRVVHLLWAQDELGDTTLRDDLTGALHADATRRLIERGRPSDTLVGFAVADTGAVEETHGRVRVDVLLRQVARFVRSELDVDERLGRLAREVLVAVLRGSEGERAAELTDRVTERWNRQRALPVALRTAVVHRGDDPGASIRELLAAARGHDGSPEADPLRGPADPRPDDRNHL